MTKAGVYLLATVSLVACGVGDGEPDEPDLNPNKLKCSAAVKTMGTFAESVSNPRPTDPLGPDGEAGTADDNTTQLQGCWPVGTWTFTASFDPAAEVVDITGDGVGEKCGTVAGTSPPTFEASYSFRVDRVDDGDGLKETYTYLGSSPGYVNVKVSEGGGGDCEGIMEFKSADSKEWWTFNPSICTSANCQPPSTTIAGSGDYTFYLEPQAGL